jgi:hypothetical protein
MLIKLFKKSFLKLRTIIGIKKFSSFIGYFLTIILLTVVFSDKLGNLTVALGVAGAGIALHFKSNRFICRLASHHVWGFTIREIAFNLAKGDVMDIGVLRTTIMETGNGLTAICITAELY